MLEVELRDKVLKIEEVSEEKTKIYEDTFAKYQGQLLGKYNELKTKMEDHFNSVFKKMQAHTRKEFENMQQKFAKKEQELDVAFKEGKMSRIYCFSFVSGRNPSLSCNLIGYSSGRNFTMS